jgi:hypothetical protein
VDVLDWLLDSDPAIRWQVLRDLADASAEIFWIERARVANEGWGARLLALQGEDGQWAAGALFPNGKWNRNEPQPWTATANTLVLLQEFGVDPRDEEVRGAVAQVREHAAGDMPASRSLAARSSLASTAWSSRSAPTSVKMSMV